ncbi:MAG: hypothetical protein ACJ73N_01020, partial [Bryobacteraceae bacterium]
LTNIRNEWQLHSRNLDSEWKLHRERLELDYRATLRSMSGLYGLSRVLVDVTDATKERPEIAVLLKDILTEYAEGIRPKSDGFSIDDRNWTMEVLVRFYRAVHNSGKEIGEIRVTHRGSLDIWQNWEATKQPLNTQRALAINKGTPIRRIFVGTEVLDEKTLDESAYRDIMDEMVTYKILSYYVRRTNLNSVRDITWVPALGIFMEWFLLPGGSVGQVSLRSDAADRVMLEEMWQGLISDIKAGRGVEYRENACLEKELAGIRKLAAQPSAAFSEERNLRLIDSFPDTDRRQPEA